MTLGVTASPTSIDTTQTSIIQVNLTYDSDGIYHNPGSGHVPDVIPVTYIVSSGPVQYCLVQPGWYPGYRRPGSPNSSGTAIVSATVDGQTVSAVVDITGQSTSTTITTTTGVDIKLSSSQGTLTDAAAFANPSPADMPADVRWPLGFIEFTVTDLTPGGSTIVTLSIPDDVIVNTYWKVRQNAGQHIAALV